MLLNTLLLALRSIRRNLMRSFLTILGIVIGVSAVITMVTLGNGATKMVSDQIASLGSNLLMVMPGQRLGLVLVFVACLQFGAQPLNLCLRARGPLQRHGRESVHRSITLCGVCQHTKVCQREAHSCALRHQA